MFRGRSGLVAEYFWTAVEWEAYDRKTAHLSLAQDGAYRRLLSHYYRTRKPLPANAEILLRVCRAFDDTEKAAVMLVVEEFFTLEDDGYHNRRADAELEKQAQVSEKRREAGKKGAEKTNGKRAANGSANERQMPTQSQLHIKPISIPQFVLPCWVPEKPWNDFLMMREKMRKPPTIRAKELIVMELEKLLNQGHDPAEVLNQSTKKSYLDVYPLGESRNGTNRQNQPIRVSAAAARNERNAQAFANVARKIGLDTPMAATGEPPVQRGVDGGGHRVLAADPIILPPKGNRDIV
jgi:uncharacterized protein YdaU (DUF1376 family)